MNIIINFSTVEELKVLCVLQNKCLQNIIIDSYFLNLFHKECYLLVSFFRCPFRKYMYDYSSVIIFFLSFKFYLKSFLFPFSFGSFFPIFTCFSVFHYFNQFPYFASLLCPFYRFYFFLFKIAVFECWTCSLEVSEFEIQSRRLFHFQINAHGNPLNAPSYALNSITAVLQQGWLWHGWY